MPTQRKAKVKIKNETGQSLLSVSVTHKYSDNYTNNLVFEGGIAPSSTTGYNKKEIEFNTGWNTTGRDWWVVSWVTEDGKTHITDPNNFRNIIDFLERMTNKFSAPLSTLAVVLAASPEPVVTKTTAAALVVVSAITEAFCNDASTTGMKQHILRENDNLEIRIKDNKVTFHSQSGDSSTGTTVVSK